MARVRDYDVIERKEPGLFGDWSARVRLADGRIVWVGVNRGKRVRIAFKPSGPKGWGYHWYGYVRDEKGHDLMRHDRVPKSIGILGLLHDAGLVIDPKRYYGFACCLACYAVDREYMFRPMLHPNLGGEVYHRCSVGVVDKSRRSM